MKKFMDTVLLYLKKLKGWIISNPKKAMVVAIFIIGVIIGGILF
jgi:hypothetical protein